MIIEILKRTPTWVFVLFFVLLALGYLQSRPRVVSRARVALLPAAMMLLSIYGVPSAFGSAPIAIVAWAVGVGLTVWSNRWLAYPRGVAYSAAARSYSMPGSWLPLALMMTIFFVRYAVAVTVTRNPGLTQVTEFAGGVSLGYGLLSGVFFAGALSAWRLANRSPAVA